MHLKCIYTRSMRNACIIIERYPQDNYDIAFVNDVYQSTVVSYSELKSGNIVASGPVRIPYYTRQSFKNTSKLLGLMDDFRVMRLSLSA